MRFEAETFAEAYNQVLAKLGAVESEVSPRGMATKELLATQVVVRNPRARLAFRAGRKFSLPFAVAEALWIALGRDDLGFIERYNARYREFSDDGEKLYGAYGARRDMAGITARLSGDLSTRQAVTVIYRPDDLRAKSKDIPCTVSWQFLAREGKLHMVCTMRSNDVWWGLPYDLFVNTMMQEWLAVSFGLELGDYVHQAGSTHVYERNFEDLGKGQFFPVSMPEMSARFWTDLANLEKTFPLKGPTFGGFDQLVKDCAGVLWAHLVRKSDPERAAKIAKWSPTWARMFMEDQRG